MNVLHPYERTPGHFCARVRACVRVHTPMNVLPSNFYMYIYADIQMYRLVHNDMKIYRLMLSIFYM